MKCQHRIPYPSQNAAVAYASGPLVPGNDPGSQRTKVRALLPRRAIPTG
jgi:hypothetical protein